MNAQNLIEEAEFDEKLRKAGIDVRELRRKVEEETGPMLLDL